MRPSRSNGPSPSLPVSAAPAITGTLSTRELPSAVSTVTLDEPRITDGAAPPAAKGELPFLSPPQAPDELGRLGKYRVLKELGRGGMGVVLLAEDERLGRKVALKVMRPEIVAENLRERFLREARAVALVEHERVVPVYEADEVNGVLFLAMRLLAGESLHDRLRRRPGLTLAEAVRIGRETAEGLTAAHQRGLVHRDVKPANLWLETTEDGWHVRVLDFGLARLQSGDTPLTQPGALLGTPAYMAPEQARGDEVDGRCDLFSLGCVLYQLLTGGSPFMARDTMAVLRRLELHQPDAPRKLNPAVPQALSKLVMRLLAKDPDDRSESARVVVEELREIEKTLPSCESTTAPPNPTPPLGPTTSLPNPTPRLGPSTSSVASQNLRSLPMQQQRRWRRFGRRWFLAGAGAGVLAVLAAVFVIPPHRGIPHAGDPMPQPDSVKGLPPLKGSIDILIYEDGNPRRQNIFLDDPGAMPLRPGDEVSIEAELNRKAYVYVLWIDTDGKVQPVYPWQPGHWEERPAEERPVAKVRRPEALDEFYQVSKGTPGMETLVLLARETPLPLDVDLVAELSPLPRPAAQELKATAWFENGVVVRNRRGREGMFDVKKRDDPVLTTQQRIKERLLGRHFDYVMAVSFANQGR